MGTALDTYDQAIAADSPQYSRLFGLSWLHFLNDGSANYLPGVLPAVLLALHEKTALAGSVMAALLVGQTLQVPSGWWADRVGGRALARAISAPVAARPDPPGVPRRRTRSPRPRGRRHRPARSARRLIRDTQFAISPAVMLIANPRMATLNANEMISWTISTRRMEVCVVDTSAVWLAAAIVMEK